jgi:tRNA(Glu) U13 pseudouridine synthase TruD
MRLMYVHSFTSLVWNHLTTQRLATHGTSIVEGDLVEILTNNEERLVKFCAYDHCCVCSHTTAVFQDDACGHVV